MAGKPPPDDSASGTTRRLSLAPSIHSPHSFNALPVLEFDHSLQLVHASEAAHRLFASSSSSTVSAVSTASELLRRDGDGTEEGRNATLKLLESLAERSRCSTCGEGVELEYWTGDTGHRELRRSLPECSIPPLGSPDLDGNSPVTFSSVTRAARRNSTSSHATGSSNTDRTVEKLPPLLKAGTPASQRPKRTDDTPTRPLDDILRKITGPDVGETSEGKPDSLVMNEVEMDRFLETLPSMCFKASDAGHTVWFNGEWYRYTGLSEEDSLNYEKWAQLFLPEDLEYVLPLWTEKMKTGESFRFEYRIRGANGVYRWFVCQGRAAKDRDGNVLSWACSVTDVEELVKARSEAMQVREHLRAILFGANIVLLTLDRSNIVTFYEGALQLVSKPIEVGKTSLSEVWPDDRLETAAKRVMGAQEAVFTAILDYDEGARHVRYHIVPLLGGPGASDDEITGVIIVAADVTVNVKTEEALQLAQKEQAELRASELAAKEASRLKTAFLTNLSHEIRTPIAGVLGILELLDTDATLAENHRSLVGKAIRSGELLLDLVGMVLDVRKIEAGELDLEEAPFELEQVIADARVFSMSAHRNDVSFVEDVGRFYEATLLGDRLRLRQILANALSNSVKFTKKGVITLCMRQEEETTDQIKVLFEITDTGVGIPEDVLPTLFQPFRQADASTARNYGGTGLGLVIAKSLVELMHGTIELRSTLGKGTTMTVRVPLRKAPFAEIPSQPTQKPVPSPIQSFGENGRPKREDVQILLAEDNELIREIVTRLLKKMKFSVHAVEDGAAAVAAVESKRYDLVLMDGQMPGTDGYEATGQIRRSQDPRVRSLKVIALTASAIEGDRERCIAAGMNDYLAKPVRAKDLEAAIWKHCGRVQE